MRNWTYQMLALSSMGPFIKICCITRKMSHDQKRHQVCGSTHQFGVINNMQLEKYKDPCLPTKIHAYLFLGRTWYRATTWMPFHSCLYCATRKCLFSVMLESPFSKLKQAVWWRVSATIRILIAPLIRLSVSILERQVVSFKTNKELNGPLCKWSYSTQRNSYGKSGSVIHSFKCNSGHIPTGKLAVRGLPFVGNSCWTEVAAPWHLMYI